MTSSSGRTICPPRRHLSTAVGSHMAERRSFTHGLLAPDVSCIRGGGGRNSTSNMPPDDGSGACVIRHVVSRRRQQAVGGAGGEAATRRWPEELLSEAQTGKTNQPASVCHRPAPTSVVLFCLTPEGDSCGPCGVGAAAGRWTEGRRRTRSMRHLDG